jgi:hypothetical protein
MTTVRMPMVDLPPQWTVLGREQLRSLTVVQLKTPAGRSVEVTISRSLATALRDAYPVSAHDVRIEISPADLTGSELRDLLRDLVSPTPVQ